MLGYVTTRQSNRQAPDRGRLAIINRSAGQEVQQIIFPQRGEPPAVGND
jgi:hypothetical protein